MISTKQAFVLFGLVASFVVATHDTVTVTVTHTETQCAANCFTTVTICSDTSTPPYIPTTHSTEEHTKPHETTSQGETVPTIPTYTQPHHSHPTTHTHPSETTTPSISTQTYGSSIHAVPSDTPSQSHGYPVPSTETHSLEQPTTVSSELPHSSIYPTCTEAYGCKHPRSKTTTTYGVLPSSPPPDHHSSYGPSTTSNEQPTQPPSTPVYSPPASSPPPPPRTETKTIPGTSNTYGIPTSDHNTIVTSETTRPACSPPPPPETHSHSSQVETPPSTPTYGPPTGHYSQPESKTSHVEYTPTSHEEHSTTSPTGHTSQHHHTPSTSATSEVHSAPTTSDGEYPGTSTSENTHAGTSTTSEYGYPTIVVPTQPKESSSDKPVETSSEYHPGPPPTTLVTSSKRYETGTSTAPENTPPGYGTPSQPGYGYPPSHTEAPRYGAKFKAMRV